MSSLTFLKNQELQDSETLLYSAVEFDALMVHFNFRQISSDVDNIVEKDKTVR